MPETPDHERKLRGMLALSSYCAYCGKKCGNINEGGDWVCFDHFDAPGPEKLFDQHTGLRLNDA